MAMFPEMTYIFLEEDTKKQIEESSDVRKIIFEKLVVGVNVSGTEAYQRVAAWLLKVPESKLKKLTIENVLEGVGEYMSTGYLV